MFWAVSPPTAFFRFEAQVQAHLYDKTEFTRTRYYPLR
jgi:hypothetical protein